MRVYIDRDIEPLIPDFLANRAADIQQLATLLRQGDRSAISAVAHRVKGVAGSYGFPGLSELASRIELELPDGDNAKIHALIEAMSDYLDSLEISYT